MDNPAGRQFSRRQALIGGGVALGALGVAGIVTATGQPAAAAQPAPQVPAPTTARVGATFNLYPFAPGTTYPQALSKWNDAVSSPGMLRPSRCWKGYYEESKFPTKIDSQLKTVIDNDIQALISFKPAITPSPRDRGALATAVKMFHDAHLKAEICLWQEVRPEVMTPAQYLAYVKYYGPTIREYYPLIFDAAGTRGPKEWQAYDPGHAYVDGYAVDYYGPTYYKLGYKLDALASMAGTLPIGIWEIGTATREILPNPTQLGDYMTYITGFLSQRLSSGLPVGSIAWYNGPADAKQSNHNQIVGQHPSPLAPEDIKYYRTLYDTINGKTPSNA
jgi:hypothetical protein